MHPTVLEVEYQDYCVITRKHFLMSLNATTTQFINYFIEQFPNAASSELLLKYQGNYLDIELKVDNKTLKQYGVKEFSKIVVAKKLVLMLKGTNVEFNINIPLNSTVAVSEYDHDLQRALEESKKDFLKYPEEKSQVALNGSH